MHFNQTIYYLQAKKFGKISIVSESVNELFQMLTFYSQKYGEIFAVHIVYFFIPSMFKRKTLLTLAVDLFLVIFNSIKESNQNFVKCLN